MITLDGYRVEKCLSSNAGTAVYAGTREEDGQRVALKVYRDGRSQLRMQREFETLQRATGQGIPRALELTYAGTQPVLVMELIGGRPLRELLEKGPCEPGQFLALALELVQIVAHVHEVHIVHKDLKPSNVLFDAAAGKQWLIDFGSAAHVGSRGDVSSGDETHMEGTLLYISPEATGRMDRGVDCRSDLYSLGATFYHLLTGRPPFASHDGLELIHCHLARLPEPPVVLRPGLPATLSRIVMKLLQKEPEERYQRARSLGDDLRHCQNQLAAGVEIADDFPLGSSDAPQRPLFPKRLHGRDRECAALADAFARVVLGGSEFWLLVGPPGGGKSALAATLRLRASSAGGQFASGKFDLYRREVPYSGWILALDSLLQQRLMESPARLEELRQRLLTGLGNLAGALVQLVPDLEHVVGDVPQPPALEPLQTQQRLALAVQRFVCACATREQPLVLFFDDLQWADAASLYVMEDLLLGAQSGALLLLGAYRDSDPASDSLRAWLARLEARGLSLHTLELGPLGEDACVQMLAEVLQRSPQDVRPLARQVALKTGNLPLLVQQFIDHAHELGLIRFAAGHGWTWHELDISTADIPDDAAGLLAARIERLAAKERAVLELASCVGDAFDGPLLAELGGGPCAELEASLYRLCDEGLIAPCARGFRFVHDRIRESAQALLTDEARARLHYAAAHLLQASVAAEAREERIFELTDHFNRALSLLAEHERVPVIELNLAAAGRALAAGASATAQPYLRQARSLFRADDWTSHRELGIRLWLRSAACAHQLGALDECLELLDALELQPLSSVQRAGLTAQRITVYAVRHEVERATRLGLSALREFGVRWPLHPSHARTRLADLCLALELRGRGVEAFRPTRSYEPRWFAQMVLMAAVGGPASRADVRLVSLISSWSTRVQLRKGVLRGPQLSFAAMASNLCRLAADGARARRYAELAEALSGAFPDPVYRCRTQMVLYGNVYPWLMPRVQALERLLQVREAALELGDREFAMYASAERTYGRLFSGVALPSVLEDLSTHLRLPAGTRLPSNSTAAVRALQQPYGDAAIDADLNALDLDFKSLPMLATHVRMVWVLALCVLGRHADAVAQSARLGEPATMGTLWVDLDFLHGLSAAALAHERGARRRACTKVLRRSVRRLAAWARHGPDFAHMAELLRAEEAALRGRAEQARAHYRTAARLAQQQGYIHHAALAHEREGELLLRLRRETDGERAFARACELYEQWGALGKVERMKSRSEPASRKALR